MEQITKTTKTATHFEVEPTEGWTRNDIVLALRQDRAQISSDNSVIVQYDQEAGSKLVIAKIIHSNSLGNVNWE